MKKELLVLAKSFKTGGFCIAGCEIFRGDDGRNYLSNQWVRPVLSRDGVACGSVPAHLCEGVAVLDIVEVDFDGGAPIEGQPENWLMAQTPIRKLAEFTNLRALGFLSSDCSSAWTDTSTLRADQVRRVVARESGCSLTLLAPEHLTFTLALEEGWDGAVKRRIYASFTAGGQAFSGIRVTDPVMGRIFNNQFPTTSGSTVERRLYHGDKYFLTMSLSPRFKDGFHYVLVAAVVDQTGYLNRAYR